MAATEIADDSDLERLLAACARRDSRALRALYDQTAPHLLACLMRILRRRALAEDVLQEVFVSIWQRATQYEPERGRPRAWLFSIARHRAIDVLRREKPEAALGEDLAERIPDPSGDDVTDSITGSRVTAALARCLGLLNGDQRRGIQLAFVDGLSHAEIATMTGEPLGTIKSWIRRGLLSLRQCMER
jgi:RNA polymerase sigma-70 factor, ECF subfamily